MKTVWVVVADEAIARVLEFDQARHKLNSVEEITDPTAHAKGVDLRNDSYGRRAGSATHSASPNNAHRLRSSSNVTSSAGEGEQHVEAQQFAARVALRLKQALQEKRFDELQVCAAPRFLGLLRKAFDKPLETVVTSSTDKDLVHLTNDDIAAHLFPAKRQDD